MVREIVFGRFRPTGAGGRTPTLSARRAISGPSSSIRPNRQTHPIAPGVGTFGWFAGVFSVSGTYVTRLFPKFGHLGPLWGSEAQFGHLGAQWAQRWK